MFQSLMGFSGNCNRNYFALSIELAIACRLGMWQGLAIGEASFGKIAVLATITAKLFGARQWRPISLCC
ncbi:hypothetical protein QUB05_04145 [Microcoleus sp. F10-C6]|uniref:hypothetical protein n=1 Tax=unclassified Microcoleus TaxID=2642155 RepID=UPI002FD02D2D